MILRLRDAVDADAELLLEWRNEPLTRSNSFSEEVVNGDDHQAWFSSRMAARDQTRIWILMDDEHPAGQARFEKRGADRAEVSISIDASFRGRGLAVELLRRSAPRACQELDVREIRGKVKSSNAASLAAFARAGFTREDDEITGGEPCAVFLWRSSAR